MLHVPRHEFVPSPLIEAAYDYRPLPLGDAETISQPYIVAAMTEAARVEPGDKALEVGTGSGYQAAILAYLGARVYTVERNAALAETARERLERLGYDGVEVIAGDGSEGYPPAAPYADHHRHCRRAVSPPPCSSNLQKKPPGDSGRRPPAPGPSAQSQTGWTSQDAHARPLPVCAAGRKAGWPEKEWRRSKCDFS